MEIDVIRGQKCQNHGRWTLFLFSLVLEFYFPFSFLFFFYF